MTGVNCSANSGAMVRNLLNLAEVIENNKAPFGEIHRAVTVAEASDGEAKARQTNSNDYY